MSSDIRTLWSQDNIRQSLGIFVHVGLQRRRWGTCSLVSAQLGERGGIFGCEGWHHPRPLFVFFTVLGSVELSLEMSN